MNEAEIDQESGLTEEIMTPSRLAWMRLTRNKLALTGLAVILVLAVVSLAAPFVAPFDRDYPDIRNREEPPGEGHILGTDELGRDVFSRLLYGGRVSLTVGIVAVSISVTIGTILGALAGYFGGVVDNIIMRLVDIVISFPFLMLALVLAAIIGPSIYTTMLVLGIIGWTGTCRLVRGEFLSLREQDFVEAASAVGATRTAIIFRHILPNAISPVIVAATLQVATAILLEAGLSFLGLGVQQPIPSWGNMLSAAQSGRILENQWWRWLPPGIMIFIAVLSINIVGDGLRDALDPKMKR